MKWVTRERPTTPSPVRRSSGSLSFASSKGLTDLCNHVVNSTTDCKSVEGKR